MANPFDQFATEVRAAVPDVAAPSPTDPSPFGAPAPTSVMNPPPQANGYGGYGAAPPQQPPPMAMGQPPNPYGAPQGGYGMPPQGMANGGDFGSPAMAMAPAPAPPMSSFSSPPPAAAPSDPFGGGGYAGYSQPPAPVPGASPPFQMPESAPPPMPEAAPSSPGANPFGAPVPQQNGGMPPSPGADNPFGAAPMQPPQGAPPMPPMGAPPPPQQNPYGADPSQNPYGADPSQQSPYGVPDPSQQSPYGAPPPQQNPPGPDPSQNPYGADPVQHNPYGTDPSQQSPYGAPPAPQNPYGADPSQGARGPPPQQYGADPWGGQPPAGGAIVPAGQPADPMAGALVPAQQQPQQQYGNVDPFSVFASSPAPPPEPAPLAVAPAPAPMPQQQQPPMPQQQPPSQSEDDLWADMGFDKPVPDAPKAEESAMVPAGGETSNVAPGELPPGGEWYDARIFTPTLGVMFFKPQELTDSLFLQTDKSMVDALEERPVVAFIVEGSSARSAGVELGHVLLKVNGIDVKNPKEASRLIKEGPRPLPLLFYVPDTNVVVAEGEHMVKYDTRETTAPNSAKDWKPKYVVIGGIIAQPWMMNMYRSKSEYDIAVIETQARRPVSVKVKQFSLQGARIQNDWQGPQMVKYKNKLHPWKYIVILPVARNPIKISSPNLSQLKPVHEGIRRVLLAQQSNRGGHHGHTAAPVRGDPYARPQNGHGGGDPYASHSAGPPPASHSGGGGGGYDSRGPPPQAAGGGYDGRGSHGGGDPYARGGGDPYARGGDPYARPAQQAYNNY